MGERPRKLECTELGGVWAWGGSWGNKRGRPSGMTSSAGQAGMCGRLGRGEEWRGAGCLDQLLLGPPHPRPTSRSPRARLSHNRPFPSSLPFPCLPFPKQEGAQTGLTGPPQLVHGPGGPPNSNSLRVGAHTHPLTPQFCNQSSLSTLPKEPKNLEHTPTGHQGNLGVAQGLCPFLVPACVSPIWCLIFAGTGPP